MKIRHAIFSILMLSLIATVLGADVVIAQARGARAGAAAAAPRAQQVHGTLLQVMRGILFPNSNVLFSSQSVDPASVKKDAATAKFKTGVGGELWFDALVGYVVGFTFRLGYARGLASGGIDKLHGYCANNPVVRLPIL